MTNVIKCLFSAPGQLCGKMKVKTDGGTGEKCSLLAGECPHQGFEQPAADIIAENKSDQADIFTKVIEFAIETDSSKEFLTCWLEGDFESIKNEWPEFEGYLGE